ncbi:MAG: clostripain-related cysteine peptidase [Candidatus Zixiibacteriota bacterium]
MKAFKITSFLLVVILTLLAACSKKNGPGPDEFDHKWAILGYFDGNNSEDQTPGGHSYVIQDLQELEQIGSTDDVQVVVMLGSFKTEGNCRYYHVGYHPNEPPDVISSEVLLDLGKKDMSDPTTLRDFISYGAENYRAERYMLIVNDHGGGWKGLCSDAINGDGEWMSLPELSTALSGFEFDIIWFYAPSMATAEVAYQIRDRATYMIASQFDSYPTSIMGSTVWLADLTDNPDMYSIIFASKVTEEVYEAARSISPVKRVHSVLIHLRKMAQVAADASDLGEGLVGGAGAFWSEVWDAWDVSHNYLELDSTVVDLREFAREIQTKTDLNLLIRADAEDLEASLKAAVFAQFMYPEWISIGGLSIHLPWNQIDFDSLDYAQLDFSSTGWPRFLSTFIQTFSSSYGGILDVGSEPPGASVYLDGVDTGYKTRAIIRGLFPKLYELRLVKSGCNDLVLSIQITAGDSLVLPLIRLTCP